MLSKPLRFILLLDSDNVPAWQAQCIREALDSKAAVLVAVVMRAESVATPRPSLLGRLKANRSKLLWRAFNRLYVNKICTASRLESLRELLQDIPVIEDDPVGVGRFSERLSDTALTFVEEAQPDFILRFGFGILKGPILKAAPLGIWSFHHGDEPRRDARHPLRSKKR